MINPNLQKIIAMYGDDAILLGVGALKAKKSKNEKAQDTRIIKTADTLLYSTIPQTPSQTPMDLLENVIRAIRRVNRFITAAKKPQEIKEQLEVSKDEVK